MVAIVIEAAVMAARQNRQAIRQIETTDEFRPHWSERLPSPGEGRHQPLPTAGTDDRRPAALRDVPEMRLRTKEARFRGRDPGKPPRPILRHAEIPARLSEGLRLVLLHPVKLPGLVRRAMHRRAAAIEKGAGERRISLSDVGRQRLFIVDHREGGAIPGIRVGAGQHAAGTMSGCHEGAEGMAAREGRQRLEHPLAQGPEIVMAPGRSRSNGVCNAERLDDRAVRRGGAELDIGLADVEDGDHRRSASSLAHRCLHLQFPRFRSARIAWPCCAGRAGRCPSLPPRPWRPGARRPGRRPLPAAC